MAVGKTMVGAILLLSCLLGSVQGFGVQYSILPGVLRGRFGIIRDADYPNGDHFKASMTVAGDQYIGVGFSYTSMAGPIVACHVGSNNVAVCRNLEGKVGGGISSTIPPQTVKVLESYIDSDGFRTVTYVVPTSSLNLTDPKNTRMIFAHGTWDASKNLPTYHGLSNASIMFVNLYETEASPVFEVFRGAMNVQWRVQRNSEAAKGDSLSVTIRLTSESGGMFQAIGFSPYSMHGPIVACHVDSKNTSNSICKNYIGINGGGIHQKLPPQTVRLVYAEYVPATFEYVVEFEVPVSALNLTNPETTYSRLIFAHGVWDAVNQRPTYHGPNATILHVNLYTSEIRSDMAVQTQWSENTEFQTGLPGSPNIASIAWHLELNGTGAAASFVELYLRFNQNYWGIVGWTKADGTGPLVAVNYQPGNPLQVLDIDAVLQQGQVVWNLAKNQVSSVSAAWEMRNEDHILLRVPLSRAPVGNSLTNSYFGLAFNDFSNPTGANFSGTAFINFFTNEMSLPRARGLTVLDGAVTASWKLVQEPVTNGIEVELSVVGGYNTYVAIGFSPYNMYGFITACYVDPTDATNCVCHDFIGQDGGGVHRNPVQTSKLLSCSHNNGGLRPPGYAREGTSIITFVTTLDAVNVTAEEAYTGTTRLIFAHGVWDTTLQRPIYHGPNNATIRHLNLATGTPVSSPKLKGNQLAKFDLSKHSLAKVAAKGTHTQSNVRSYTPTFAERQKMLRMIDEKRIRG